MQEIQNSKFSAALLGLGYETRHGAGLGPARSIFHGHLYKRGSEIDRQAQFYSADVPLSRPCGRTLREPVQSAASARRRNCQIR